MLATTGPGRSSQSPEIRRSRDVRVAVLRSHITLRVHSPLVQVLAVCNSDCNMDRFHVALVASAGGFGSLVLTMRESSSTVRLKEGWSLSWAQKPLILLSLSLKATACLGCIALVGP